MSVKMLHSQAVDTTPILASVIVPAYNAMATIAASLHSAQSQSEPRIEILVVDDCSSDATAQVVQTIGQQDPRVRLLRMAANGGPAAARNTGIDAARGEWIALLDADDQFAAARLEQLILEGARVAADIVSDNLLLCPNGDILHGRKMIPDALLPRPPWLTATEFVRRNVGDREHASVRYGFLHPIIRRDFLQRHQLRYDEANRFGEDFMLYTRCLLRGARWWMTADPTYHYNVRGDSLTQVQTAGDLNRIRMMEHALLADPAVGADAELTRALRRHKQVIDRCYYYRAFTDAVKARRLTRAAAILLDSPNSARHVATEAATQLPIIVRKAWQGGYRRGPAA